MFNEEINPKIATRIKRDVSNLNYDERKDYLQQKGYPLKLYKYIPESYNKQRLEQYLLKVECWLSNPRTFNDPFDMNAKIEFDAHVLEKRKKLANLLTADEPAWSRQEIESEVTRILGSKKITKEHVSKILEDAINNCGVACFTSDPLSNLMWAHYASSHKGIALEYDLAIDTDFFLGASNVEYEDPIPIFNWWEIDTHDQITKILLRKNKSWCYEKERRVIIFGKSATAAKLKPNALTGVIKGINFSNSSFKVDFLDVIKQRESVALPKLNLYQAVLNKDEEKIELESCT